jgi:RNA polymerase sigma-70 factor (ECF subfamily)
VDELVVAARGGDRRALEALFEKALAPIYRYVAFKLGSTNTDVEDVVQETLIGAMGSISRLRGDDEAALMSWLLSIARFKVADHLRARYNQPADSLNDEARPEVRDRTDVEAAVIRGTQDQMLRDAVRQLTPEQEEVVTLRFLMGYEIEQVARIVGRTEGAVKALQHRGLATLRRRLEEENRAWA